MGALRLWKAAQHDRPPRLGVRLHRLFRSHRGSSWGLSVNAQQTRTVRRARAGQPVSEGTTSARTINASLTGDPLALHRVDGKYLEGSHASMAAGTYEHRPLPIDVAKPDSETGYDLKGKNYRDDYDAGSGWFVVAIVVIVAFTAFGTYINFK